MPTKSHRVMFIPSPEVHQLLQRYSAATRQPISSIVRETMDAVLPHLLTMVDLMERASQLSDGVREAAGAAAKDAEQALMPLLEEAQRAMLNLERVLDEPGLPLPPAKPPSSNTGATWSPESQREVA